MIIQTKNKPLCYRRAIFRDGLKLRRWLPADTVSRSDLFYAQHFHPQTRRRKLPVADYWCMGRLVDAVQHTVVNNKVVGLLLLRGVSPLQYGPVMVKHGFSSVRLSVMTAHRERRDL
jgi:hypothetical protein